MHLVAHGDQEAFAELYERLSGGLFSFAYLILFDHEESELVVQEVFIAIWKNAPSFAENYGQVLNWATTLTRHRACDLAQARKNNTAVLTKKPLMLPASELNLSQHF